MKVIVFALISLFLHSSFCQTSEESADVSSVSSEENEVSSGASIESEEESAEDGSTAGRIVKRFADWLSSIGSPDNGSGDVQTGSQAEAKVSTGSNVEKTPKPGKPGVEARAQAYTSSHIDANSPAGKESEANAEVRAEGKRKPAVEASAPGRLDQAQPNREVDAAARARASAVSQQEIGKAAGSGSAASGREEQASGSKSEGTTARANVKTTTSGSEDDSATCGRRNEYADAHANGCAHA